MRSDPDYVLDPETEQVAYASAVPFARADLKANKLSTTDGPVFPSATIRSLPRDGVLISAGFLQFPATRRLSPQELRLPLQLSDFEIQHSWEGQVASNVPLYLLPGDQANGISVDVRMFFGTQDPPPDVLQAAQDELERLEIPGVRLPESIPAPEFPASRGWRTIGTNLPSTDSVSDARRLAQGWASTVPFDQFDLRHVVKGGHLAFASWPAATVLRSLPSDGIVMVATAMGFPQTEVTAAAPDPAFPERHVPLQLSDATVRAWRRWANPSIRQYVITARVGGVYVDLRVFFAKPNPGPGLLHGAQQELDQLRLPAY